MLYFTRKGLTKHDVSYLTSYTNYLVIYKNFPQFFCTHCKMIKKHTQIIKTCNLYLRQKQASRSFMFVSI